VGVRCSVAAVVSSCQQTVEVMNDAKCLFRELPGKVDKLELTKLDSAPDGGKAAYCRMAELYFLGQSEMQQTLASPEGKAAVADLPNFATGGVTVIIGNVES
jgi:uncharacterized protein (TIGR02118 family)